MTDPAQPPLRQRQAQRTRAEIIAAARSLFAVRGYVETSMAEIAAEAGVAVQTVYKVMGSKAAIMGSLIGAINETADVALRQRELASAETAPAILSAGIALMSQIQERCGDIIVAIHSAATAAPEAAEALADGERFHRQGTSDMVERIAALGALRLGLAPHDAARILSVMTSHHAFRELVGARALNYEQAASWLEEQLTKILLA